MSKYYTDQYSFTESFSRKVTFGKSDDLGCVLYAGIVVAFFMVFGFYAFFLLPVFVGILVVWGRMIIADRESAFSAADKITVTVPIHATYQNTDNEGSVTYGVTVKHPEDFSSFSFPVEGWLYCQLEKGSEVQLTYSPELPGRCELSVNLTKPLSGMAPPVRFAPSPKVTAQTGRQYYEHNPPFFKMTGWISDEDTAEDFGCLAIVVVFLTLFALVVAYGFWAVLCFPLCLVMYSFLHKWAYNRRKTAFVKAEKITAPAPITSKHQGGNGNWYFLVLQHPNGDGDITVPVDQAIFDRTAVGDVLPFTYSPDHPEQYYLDH